jgi:hypothetical protein
MLKSNMTYVTEGLHESVPYNMFTVHDGIELTQFSGIITQSYDHNLIYHFRLGDTRYVFLEQRDNDSCIQVGSNVPFLDGDMMLTSTSYTSLRFSAIKSGMQYTRGNQRRQMYVLDKVEDTSARAIPVESVFADHSLLPTRAKEILRSYSRSQIIGFMNSMYGKQVGYWEIPILKSIAGDSPPVAKAEDSR